MIGIFKMAAVSMETGKWTKYWTLQYLGNLGAQGSEILQVDRAKHSL